jgi:alpha-L-arabinofuranosidase
MGGFFRRSALAAAALEAFVPAGGLCQIPAAAFLPDSRITVSANQVRNRIQPEMYGSCIEDVNHEIYGGLFDDRIFGGNFEEPPTRPAIFGWRAFGGDWMAAGGGVSVHADAGAKLVRDAPGFADGTVAADVRFPRARGDNAGLLMRVTDPAVGADNFDGYEISLNPVSQRVILGKHRHDWRPLAEAAVPVKVGAANRLRVVLDGPRIRIFVGESPIPAIDFTDVDRPILRGTIALRTWNADASFGSVRITANSAVTPAAFTAAKGYAVSGAWDPVVTGTAAADFAPDALRPFCGRLAQKIVHGPGVGHVGIANRGLNRWGIAVGRGQTFAGSVYLRGDPRGPVTVALESADGTRTYGRATLTGIGPAWGRHAFRLTASAADANARFTLTLDQPGAVSVDQAALMGTGAEQFHGLPIRADLANRLVAGGITFLRYGGTMVNAPEYRWKNMIGDPDKRPPYTGHWYPYATNRFGIFDFLNFCEAAHIEAAFAINAEETDADAADLADYLAGPTTTIWGRRRAADGHPQPYRIRYLEIGNEEVIWGDRPADYAHYARRFAALAHALHARNPALPLVCAAWWRPESPSMKTVFSAVDGQAAAWDLHVDSNGIRSGVAVEAQLSKMQAAFGAWNPRSELKAVIFEENGDRHDVQRALGHATSLIAALRHGDFVLADCPANCLQPYRQNDNGWDQGQIFFTPERVWGMPPYYAQQMASAARLPLRIASGATSPDGDLDVTATRSEDGATLALLVVNAGTRAHTATLDLAGFQFASSPTLTTLTGALTDVNTPADPNRIAPRASAVAASAALTFPAQSFTVVTLHGKSLLP